MKIRITRKMLMQAIAPAVKQYAAGYSPALSKYEELRELIFDIEANVNKPQVIEMLRGVVKGGNVKDVQRAKRVTNKLFQYLDSIKGDEQKMADLERKIATFNPERKSDLERAQTLEYGDDQKDLDDEYVERQVEEDKPQVKQGKTNKANDTNKKKPDFSQRRKDKATALPEGKTHKANDPNKKPDYRKQRAEREKSKNLKESISKKN